ncbi:MAG: glutamate formimidoyltransferase [Bacteroidia bacterium]|nr:glutamate formimidoyltransferase [Bacteroidia bacterium]
MPLVECIPNFSEGRDSAVIEAIVAEISGVAGVKILHVDVGHSANRTVVTFAGEPEAVVEGAFRGIRKAAQRIDMRKHRGNHPRMGATDVCPLVPVSGISFEKLKPFAHRLAQRVGKELNIPVYLYEKTATREARKKLENIRSGEYEGFREKILLPQWKPDYGPQKFQPGPGQTVIGVRDFLIAFNVNLNTRSAELAGKVASDIRESGNIKREGGKIVKDKTGKSVRIPGKCKGVKAIGWYVEEYGIAQVSTNLTDLSATSLHALFEAVCESAQKRGLRVTGSELIGMIPLKCLTEAGRFYLSMQGETKPEVPERDLVFIAARTMGLSDVVPFVVEEKVIEYRLEKM